MPRVYHSVNPVLIDGWYIDDSNVIYQTTDIRSIAPEDVQIYNMNVMYRYFISAGWTANAIAGMIGNVMVESGLNPGAIQNYTTADWNNPQSILDSTGGIGLTQWTPARKYYEWAVSNNLEPRSGVSMCERIIYESQNNLQWSLDNVGRHTWHDFITSTEEPWLLADVWLWAYERPTDPDEEQRWENAEWVYQNIHGTIDFPLPVLLYMGTRKKGVNKRWQTI